LRPLHQRRGVDVSAARDKFCDTAVQDLGYFVGALPEFLMVARLMLGRTV
jgi:hypothetical protein